MYSWCQFCVVLKRTVLEYAQELILSRYVIGGRVLVTRRDPRLLLFGSAAVSSVVAVDVWFGSQSLSDWLACS